VASRPGTPGEAGEIGEAGEAVARWSPTPVAWMLLPRPRCVAARSGRRAAYGPVASPGGRTSPGSRNRCARVWAAGRRGPHGPGQVGRPGIERTGSAPSGRTRASLAEDIAMAGRMRPAGCTERQACAPRDQRCDVRRDEPHITRAERNSPTRRGARLGVRQAPLRRVRLRISYSCTIA
jgi:hypothetical protein